MMLSVESRHSAEHFPAVPESVETINESQKQSVLIIENALNQIFDYSEEYQKEQVELRNIDPALDSVEDQLPDGCAGQNNLHEIIVELMNVSLRHWEVCTGKTKVDLAEESAIWKAYLDRGTWKTRTLDKYLKMETLPKKPRWREVIRTANFVLSNCDPGTLGTTGKTSNRQ